MQSQACVMRSQNSLSWKGLQGHQVQSLFCFLFFSVTVISSHSTLRSQRHDTVQYFVFTHTRWRFQLQTKTVPLRYLIWITLFQECFIACPRVVLSVKNSHITPISIYSCLLISDRGNVEKLSSRFSCCTLYKLVSLFLNSPISAVQFLLLDPSSLIQVAGNFHSLSSFYHLVICYNNMTLVKTRLMFRHNFN